ncbi:MAG: pyrimidine 5'-nucleotidase [Parvibaculaceae bacterium]
MASFMETPGFDHVETWVFDLDNTLYPASCRLFDQIDVKMGEFISSLLSVDRVEAKRIQKQFFYEHGTTLRGLMTVHGIDPSAFLDFVHDIDHSPVCENLPLARALERLPGRKLVFTNGTVAHAERVMERLGVRSHFTGIFDIIHSDYIPKPAQGPYEKFVREHGVAPQRAAMFEDIARNLEIPARLGMTTVLVEDAANVDGNLINARTGDRGAAYVHHMTSDLAGFLAGVLERLEPQASARTA